MTATTVFAPHEDLEARWHPLTDAERAQADMLLAAARGFGIIAF